MIVSNRIQKQANSLTEIISFLPKDKNNLKNIWIGKNYSLAQLIEDLEKLNV